MALHAFFGQRFVRVSVLLIVCVPNVFTHSSSDGIAIVLCVFLSFSTRRGEESVGLPRNQQAP
jgi:hypothetical protein